MMTKDSDAFVIYHNPRCSKSREALALLHQRGIEPKIIEYLKTRPTRDELRNAIKKLGIRPDALLRKGEDAFKDKFADRKLSDEEWIVDQAKRIHRQVKDGGSTPLGLDTPYQVCIVIPAKAGIHGAFAIRYALWIPAFAGMTNCKI
jgi:arsenate reductase (glutaredoxin)